MGKSDEEHSSGEAATGEASGAEERAVAPLHYTPPKTKLCCCVHALLRNRAALHSWIQKGAFELPTNSTHPLLYDG